jgi:glycosyltransferase involved in cell wall biosynthesis
MGKGQALKIAFDSWVLSSRLRHQGTYVYARNLIAQFQQMAKFDPEVIFCLFASAQAANDANSIAPDTGFEVAQSSWLARDRLWRLGGVSLAAARARADLIFSPTSNILPAGTIPVISTIHDATPVVMPSHSRKVTWMLRSLLWWSVRGSRAIITVSQCSKNDLITTYGLAESKIAVVYNGYDNATFNQDAPDEERSRLLRAKFGLERPFIWHHGVIQPRKNLKRLIDAFWLMLARNRNLDFDLVLAGPKGWRSDDIVAAAGKRQNHRGRVVLTGVLDDRDLATLLKGATLAVIPSLYEGFCFPMVEAMACGVPTVAANSSCLPEVSGGVLEYFEPRSVEDMAACMTQTLEDGRARQLLSRRGRERAEFFSWRRCAEQTLEILRRRGES